MRFLKILFILLLLLMGSILGYQFSYLLNQLDFFAQNPNSSLLNNIVLTATGAMVGFLVYPYFFRQFLDSIEDIFRGMEKRPLQEIFWGAGGLLFGFSISFLISITLVNPILNLFTLASQSQGLIRSVFVICFTLIITTVSTLIVARLSSPEKKFGRQTAVPKILDTSVIIDGRIAEILKSGFFEGEIIIPKFVLEELQHIADLPDDSKRNRGKRGLELLNKLKQLKIIRVQFLDQEVAGSSVDTKLVTLAHEIHAAILTNDFNLNKVAKFQGIPILNINELANAVKPVVLPGENLNVQIAKEGKEQNQGVAYLDDGTMIVVENGRKHLGTALDIEVTSVLQTSAGKMIFARPKP